VLPTLIVILAVTIFPTVYSLGLSLFNWEATLKVKPFIGLGNYIRLLSDSRFIHSVGVTALLVAVGVFLELVFGYALAQFFISDRRPHRALVAMMLLPVMVMPVVVGYTWRLLWDAQYGPINQVIGWIIGRPFQYTWLGNTNSAIFAILVTEIWQWTPFVFIILLAALQSVPIDVLEAALVDGASFLKRLRYVTIPHIMPAIIIALLLRSMEAFKIFDTIQVMTHGGPGRATEDRTYLIFRTGIWVSDVSTAATYSWVLVIILTVLASFFLKYAYRERG